MNLGDALYEQKSEFEKLKNNKIALTPEERKECMDRKAVWHSHFGQDGKQHPTPAVWKARRENGTIAYICNTHRAYQVRNSLDAAINIFHKFIKSTA